MTEPETGNTTTIPVDRHVGAVALYAESAYLLAVRDGFAVLDGETMGPVAPAFDDIALRMNDGSVDPLGRFVVGSMAYDASAGRGQLYLREVDGTLRTLIDGVTISNGLAWSATGETIYYVDSATHGVDIFDYDLLDGTMTNRRRHVSIDPEEGAPDGVALDAENCLWVAIFGGGIVRRYAPNGEVIAQIEVATSQVTSCTFGGPHFETLFITTACHRLDLADEANAQAGTLFVADPGCVGRPETVIPAGSTATALKSSAGQS